MYKQFSFQQCGNSTLETSYSSKATVQQEAAR